MFRINACQWPLGVTMEMGVGLFRSLDTIWHIFFNCFSVPWSLALPTTSSMKLKWCQKDLHAWGKICEIVHKITSGVSVRVSVRDCSSFQCGILPGLLVFSFHYCECFSFFHYPVLIMCFYHLVFQVHSSHCLSAHSPITSCYAQTSPVVHLLSVRPSHCGP